MSTMSNETELNDKSSDKLEVDKPELRELQSFLLEIFKLAQSDIRQV